MPRPVSAGPRLSPSVLEAFRARWFSVIVADDMTTEPATPKNRWRFLRDVLVFQVKMLLGSFRDFALVPVSLAAALLDLIYKGEREGYFFYKVMRWAWHSEEMINVYSLIKDEVGEKAVDPNYTVDSVVARIEGAVVREYQKGGSALNIKAALEKVIDQVHREKRATRDQVRDAFAGTKRVLGLKDKGD
jgi:hypothetical protein